MKRDHVLATIAILVGSALTSHTAVGQEVRETCAALLHEAAYTASNAQRNRLMQQFEGSSCVKDVTDALGPTGVPRSGTKTAIAMMALAYASTKAAIRLANENEALKGGGGGSAAGKYAGGLTGGTTVFKTGGGSYLLEKEGTLYKFPTNPAPSGPGASFKPAQK